MLWPERQQERVFGCRGLQLEVELSAKALAKCECPGFVDAAPERRVQHELHPARFVEEPFEHEGALSGNDAEHAAALGEVGDRLNRRFAIESGLFRKPLDSRIRSDAWQRPV